MTHATIRAFDFGGSGVKTAVYDVTSSGVTLASKIERFEAPDYLRFSRWLAEAVDVREPTVGVSCAGFMDLDTGVNHRWAVAGLHEYPLAAEIRKVFPKAQAVWCLNDIEAHLHASLLEHRGPVLAIAIGTSIGIAVSDEAGCIVRARRDRPLECGQIRLRTGASNDEVWWALGAAGLEEQQEKRGRSDGAKQFGCRVGAFAAQYAALFHARTVVLSGGLIAYNWEDMREATQAEFAHNVPGWMSDKPTLLASEWGRETALVGAARYAYSRMVRLA